MKTLACFITTWVTATALLLWEVRHGRDASVPLPGGQLTWSNHPQWSREFWHALWVAAIYSLITTFIVRFWHLVLELKKGN
jgi:hypothetical protein